MFYIDFIRPPDGGNVPNCVEKYETMRKLKDPRVRGRCSHSLTDVEVLTVLAVICGAES